MKQSFSSVLLLVLAFTSTAFGAARGLDEYQCMSTDKTEDFKIIFLTENSVDDKLPLVLDLTVPSVNVISAQRNLRNQLVLSGIQIGSGETILDLSRLNRNAVRFANAGTISMRDTVDANTKTGLECFRL